MLETAPGVGQIGEPPCGLAARHDLFHRRVSISVDGIPLQTPQPLEPLPYQLQIRDFLKREEAEIWNWYRSMKYREEQAEAVRFELLKSTYRVDRQSQPQWYAAAEAAAAKLGLDIPLTIYQAQNPEGMNAALAFLPGEGHLVLSGPVGEKLSAKNCSLCSPMN